MPDYRTIARSVEAIPWVDSADGTRAAISWVERFGGAAIHRQSDRRLPRFVDSLGRPISVLMVYASADQTHATIVRPGEWVVREAGHFHALSDADFRNRYEEVPA